MEKIYKFYWDCGRQGELMGVFAAEEEKVKALFGKNIYFGEVLGKHSEISGTLEEKDFEVLTDDQDFIAKARAYGLLESNGHNPLNYIEE